MTNFFTLFIALLCLAYLINYFLINSFLGYKWRLFVAPGVIVHELSHALGCFLSGAKILKISFFDKEGGSVTHQKPAVPLLGPILISLAPLIIGILIFLYLAKTIQLHNSFDLSGIYLNFKIFFQNYDLTNWLNILLIYFLLSVGVTMTPSRQDLLNIITPLLIVTLSIYAFIYFKIISFDILNSAFVKLVPILNFVILILFGLLLFSLVLWLITKLIFKS